MRAVVAVFALLAASSVQAAPALSPQAVVAAKFDAVNRHAVDEIVAFYAPEAEITASDFCASRHGRADVERTYRALFAAVPDASVEVQEYVTEGERVAVRMKVMSRLPGRAFSASLTDFFTVRDGLIVRDDGMFDNRGRPCTP